MSGIYGMLGLNDNDYAFVNTLGQQAVFEVNNRYLDMVSDELLKATSVFVQPTISEIYKERYKLPGGGYLQKVSNQTQAGAVKAYGGWDVAYPIDEHAAKISYDRISAAKLTVQEMQRHLDTVEIQGRNSLRREILMALFDNTQETFADEDWGDLLVEPLANGDTVVYPPIAGSTTEATADHYLESGYAATAISDTNNPYTTIVSKLEDAFGDTTGGSNIVVFINPAESPESMDLTDFADVPDNFIQSGADADIPQRLPNVPGKVIGRMTGASACWVVQWRWIPANYMLGIHLEVEQPLKMRVDPAVWGLPRGLQLVGESDMYPLHGAHYSHRFGVGAANRLNGVVMELGTGGTYTAPTVG